MTDTLWITFAACFLGSIIIGYLTSALIARANRRHGEWF